MPAYCSRYWGFIGRNGRVILPKEDEEHHSAIGRRFICKRGWDPGLRGKEAMLRADYIAFDVNEFGGAEFIGKWDDKSFRRRVSSFLQRTPLTLINGTVQWWFDISGRAGEAETPDEAIRLLGVV